MAQHFKLKHGFVHGHGLNVEPLDLYNLGRFFIKIVLSERIRIYRLRRAECARPKALFKFGAVAHYLLFKLAEYIIYRGVHIAGGFFPADYAARIGYRDFYNVAVALHAERNMRLGILRKVLVQLAYLFVDKLLQVIRYFDVLSADRYNHPSYPFLAALWFAAAYIISFVKCSTISFMAV